MAIAIVSLIKLPQVPELDIEFGDKIFHLVAYFILSLLWFYSFLYTFKLDNNKALFTAVLGAVFFGIIIEVLQHVITDYRALEIYDALANTIGALLTAFIIKVNTKKQVKKR